jgi:hypothetical protein
LFCLLSQQFFHSFFFSKVVGGERNNWGMTLGKVEARCFTWNCGSTSVFTGSYTLKLYFSWNQTINFGGLEET